MQKLVVYELISLDGRFSGPEGHEMDWVQSDLNAEIEDDIARQYEGVDAFIMGRTTFDSLAGYWPTPSAAGERLVGYMNERAKLVISSTEPNISAWPNSLHVVRDPVEHLRERKTQSVGDLMVIGSGTVVRLLASAGLVDEFRFLLFPVLLGEGKQLFPESTNALAARFSQTSIHQYSNGVVALHYSKSASRSPRS